MLEEVKAQRPDIGFHVLTNAQHFSRADLERLQRLDHERVLWGVPLYSATPENHDRIVGKPGAFANLEQGLSILMRAGASSNCERSSCNRTGRIFRLWQTTCPPASAF